MANKGSKRRNKYSSASGKASGKGVFSAMRGGMKSLVGAGGKKGEKKPTTFLDVLFWVLAAMLGAFVIYRWVA